MARFQKSKSSYIKSTFHQTVDGGVIKERDWPTLAGDRQRVEPGKAPVYSYGNFLFTTSTIRSYRNRRKTSTTETVYGYDDVENATDGVNSIQPSSDSRDIRDFAYFGSSVELVRASVEAIINEFPGSITSGYEQLKYDVGDTDYVQDCDGESLELNCILNNPFNIDMVHDTVVLGEYDNPYRFLAINNAEFLVNGSPITDYVVRDCECGKDDVATRNCVCQYETYKKPVFKIEITTEDTQDNPYIIYAYLSGTDYIYVYGNGYTTDYERNEIEIRPNDDVIEEYFMGLEGFERQLLNRESDPLYSNTFVTPVMGERNYKYMDKTYTWPTVTVDGKSTYCIDIQSLAYVAFIEDISSLATIMDELHTDNLWSKMTHEAIKNYDWTYTREYTDGDEEDNVEGGDRMQKILHIIGRVFDDARRYIDGIGRVTKVDYSGCGNMSDAQLSDRVELTGWDTVSTIPNVEIKIDEEPITTAELPLNIDDIEGNIEKSYDTTDEWDNKWLNGGTTARGDVYSGATEHGKWYTTVNDEGITPNTTDIDFMRRLLLSSAHICKTKGTAHAVEMIMGMFGFGKDEDYTLYEKYYIADAFGVDDTFTWEDSEGKTQTDSYKNATLELVEANTAPAWGDTEEDEYVGVPIGEKGYPNGTGDKGQRLFASYLIPYFDKNKDYNGDLYFQQKGGWGKMIADGDNVPELGGDEDNGMDYKETISYLHVLSDVSDLLEVNPRSVEAGDIYYVASLNEITDYYEAYDESGTTEINPEAISHYFMFRENCYTTDVYSSWMNISQIKDENEWDEEAYKKAMYLDGLVSSVFGNNPHAGFGNYDCGVEFFEYMQEPFRYAAENYYFDTADEREEAESFKFDIETKECDSGTITDDEYDGKVKVLDIPDDDKGDGENQVPESFAWGNPDGIYEDEKGFHTYLNSKVLLMENNVNEQDNTTLYRQYFHEIILPYLMQVIPSTTILVLKNFEY